MRLVAMESHHGGREAWERRASLPVLTELLDCPALQVGPGVTGAVRERARSVLEADGWAHDCKIDGAFNLTVTAKRSDLAVQVQTGNTSRASYDLIKVQHLYLSRAIEAAALIVPTKAAAAHIGSNVANSQRIGDELRLFDRQFTVPLLLVSFE